MIARLVGELVAREGHRAVIDVGGVGYAVQAPLRDVGAWAAATQPVVVHVHTDVREDAIVLYGFGEDADRVAFEVLRGVTGIGPTTALLALDTLGRDGLAQAVEADDVARLSSIPKVGKKLASRLALELKGRLAPGLGQAGGAAPPAEPAPSEDPLALALDRLGYSRAEIGRAQRELSGDGAGDRPLSDRIRDALRLLSGGAS